MKKNNREFNNNWKRMQWTSHNKIKRKLKQFLWMFSSRVIWLR